MNIYVIRVYQNVVKAFKSREEAYSYFIKRYGHNHPSWDIVKLPLE